MWVKHTGFWITLFLILSVGIPMFNTPASMWRNVRTELGMVDAAFGSGDAVKIATRATGVFNVVFVDTGLLKRTRFAYISEEEKDIGERVLGNPSRILSNISNNYLDCLAALSYVTLLRLFILMSFLPYIVPFLLGAIGEGFTRRQIKLATFGQYGQKLYASALHISIILLSLPMFYLLSPIPISPYFVPIWTLIASMPIVIIIANSQPILPP